MTEERWQAIIGMVKDKFEITDEQTTELPDDEGPGEVEVIEFNGPLGQMKLTWTTRPRILDKKTLGSRRIGSETAVEYIYSDTEKTHRFKAFRWDDSSERFVEMEMQSDQFSL